MHEWHEKDRAIWRGELVEITAINTEARTCVLQRAPTVDPVSGAMQLGGSMPLAGIPLDELRPIPECVVCGTPLNAQTERRTGLCHEHLIDV